MAGRNPTTILIVPGLRGHVADHWQTLLAEKLSQYGQPVVTVPPMGREPLDCATRVAAIEEAANSIKGPIVIIAHSGGCIMVAHWAQCTLRHVDGALMAVPPDFERPMPAGYPTVEELDAAAWLPVPRRRLPFPCIVATSSNDPLADETRIHALAKDWGATTVGLGAVGHLNPASGFGEWPRAMPLLKLLSESAASR